MKFGFIYTYTYVIRILLLLINYYKMQTKECHVVGDEKIGKKCLLITFSTHIFPSLYVPSIVDPISTTIKINNKLLTLRLSIAPEHYHLLRPLQYEYTDVFLICFSVVNPKSFDNVKKVWLPEIIHHCPKKPFLLIGTQIDLRDDTKTIERLLGNNQKPISTTEGELLAKEFKAIKYVECSALTQKGVDKVFENALLAALKQEKLLKGKGMCRVH